MKKHRVGWQSRANRRRSTSRRDSERHAQVAAFEAWQHRPASPAAGFTRRARTRTIDLTRLLTPKRPDRAGARHAC